MKTIDRNRAKELVESNGSVAVIDVLSQERFNEVHLPGAKNIPFSEDGFEERIQQAVPDRGATVLVYCKNEECPLAGKAARQMETMGYQNVYDYGGGIDDWQDAGLPVEK